MNWMFPAVIANAVAAVVLTLSYSYLFLVERKFFLKIWAFAWGFYTLRYIMMIFVLLNASFQSFFYLLYYQFSFMNSFFLFIGMYLFWGREVKKLWYALPVIIFIWCIGATILEMPLHIISLPIFLICGIIFIMLGVVYFTGKREFRNWYRFIGIVFILWGIHKLDYPLLRPVQWFAPWGYLISSIMALLVSLGAIFLYFHTIQSGLRLSEQALLEKQREREQLLKEMERFTYTVSHDLKSPLITIKGFLELLDEDVEEENWESFREDKGRIENAVEKMQELLNDLLEFSRLGCNNSNFQMVDVAPLVEEVVGLLEGPLKEGSIRMILEPISGRIKGDRVRIKQVFQNLIENSIKYANKKNESFIRVGESTFQGRRIFFVEDNGPGILPVYHDKIFGLFEQLSPHSQGTGVGLALVKRIVDLHNGGIWVESEGDDKGARFLFFLDDLSSPER